MTRERVWRLIVRATSSFPVVPRAALISGGGVRTGHVYIGKFSANGAHIWSKGFVAAGGGRSVGIAVDGNGNPYLLGLFSISIDIGSGTLYTYSGSDFDVFLSKYSGADGSCLWGKAFRGSGNETPTSIATDANGNVAITGYFPFSLSLGGSSLSSVTVGTSSVFVVKYSSSGAFLWSDRFGGTSTAQGLKVALQPSGHVLVGGTFMGTANFRGELLNSAGSLDAFLLRLDP